MLNEPFWIVCAGSIWRDLPERFGALEDRYQRFRKCSYNGTFGQIWHHLHLRLP
ncbi:transposase [Pseudomonas savastanoi]|uniref:transposase n=1 Tax=Pseudomonas savastanoi TaxID=29438 RepID=UPI0009B34E29